MTETRSLEDLQQHALVILRRLRHGPLTEFELASEVAEHSGYSQPQAAELMAEWLQDLTNEGLVWSGKLANNTQQTILAAALTKQGRELVS